MITTPNPSGKPGQPQAGGAALQLMVCSPPQPSTTNPPVVPPAPAVLGEHDAACDVEVVSAMRTAALRRRTRVRPIVHARSAR
jgi:hypothetical protein